MSDEEKSGWMGMLVGMALGLIAVCLAAMIIGDAWRDEAVEQGHAELLP